MPDFLATIAKASTHLVAIVIQGGLVMIPLLASSVIALTVIVERLYFWRRLRSHAVVRRILALVADGDLPQAAQEASTSRHPVARVLGAGIASKHLLPGAAMLAGMGFTVALFVTSLAFPTEEPRQAATLAILAGSVLAGAMGAVLLRRLSRGPARR